jgi:hypothetical protein
MAVVTNDLKKLLEKKAKLDAQIRQRQNRIKSEERRTDTRRKVLAGAAVLEWAKRDAEFSTRLTEELATFLTRNNERVLFDLPILPVEAKAAKHG